MYDTLDNTRITVMSTLTKRLSLHASKTFVEDFTDHIENITHAVFIYMNSSNPDAEYKRRDLPERIKDIIYLLCTIRDVDRVIGQAFFDECVHRGTELNRKSEKTNDGEKHVLEDTPVGQICDTEHTDAQKESKKKLLELLEQTIQETDDKANIIIDFLKEEYNQTCIQIDQLLLEKKIMAEKHNEALKSLSRKQRERPDRQPIEIEED